MKSSIIIGQNIKKIREQKGIKQEVLAKQIGITKGRMSQIESGDCEELAINRINKIASILQVSFFEISRMPINNINIEGVTNSSRLAIPSDNVSPELVKAITDELIHRMSHQPSYDHL